MPNPTAPVTSNTSNSSSLLPLSGTRSPAMILALVSSRTLASLMTHRPLHLELKPMTPLHPASFLFRHKSCCLYFDHWHLILPSLSVRTGWFVFSRWFPISVCSSKPRSGSYTWMVHTLVWGSLSYIMSLFLTGHLLGCCQKHPRYRHVLPTKQAHDWGWIPMLLVDLCTFDHA